MGLGFTVSNKSVVAEALNMTPLGGGDHAQTQRWRELDLPLADFMLGARRVLLR